MNRSHRIVRDLSQKLRGNVADVSDVEYQSALSIDNGRVSHEPAVVVIPVDVEDVSETVKYVAQQRSHGSDCEDEKLRLTVRCGGHGASGYCLNTGGVVMDLRLLNHKSYDVGNGLLKLGMGSIWRDVYDYVEFRDPSRVPVGGGCPSVGVGGFLLGSGFSFASRSFGLGSDNVVSLKVVKANGQIEDLSDVENKDLFWAMRGAGGGNYAIAVEAEVQARETAAEDMLVGQIIYPFDTMRDVLTFYNEWVEGPDFPREMAIYGYLGYLPNPRMPSGRKALALRLTTIFNGPLDSGMDCLAPLLRHKPQPSLVDLRRMTLPEWEDFIGAGTQIEGRSAYIRSVITPPMSMCDKTARVFMKHMIRAPSPDSFVVWTHLGGAVEEDFGREHGCFAFRDARFVPEVKAIWDSANPEEARRNIRWAYEFYEELAEATNAMGAYLNYIDPLLHDWASKYYGEHYDRLMEIKKIHDPNGFFDFQQGIGSKFSPAPLRPGHTLDLSPLKRTFC